MNDELICVASPALDLPSRSGGGRGLTLDFCANCHESSGNRARDTAGFEAALREQGMDIRELRTTIMAHSNFAVIQCVKPVSGCR
jgi:hypothetical protein